jgi:hypothetical protein
VRIGSRTNASWPSFLSRSARFDIRQGAQATPAQTQAPPARGISWLAGIRKANGATSTAAHVGTALHNPGMMPASAAIPLPQLHRSVAPVLDWTKNLKSNCL